MGQAIGEVLPSAVGVALSPVPIIAVILILGTTRATSNGPAFGAGWVVGLTVVAVVVVLVASGAEDDDAGTSTVLDVIKLTLGGLFLLLAVKQWRGRPPRGEEAPLPKWMATVDAISPGKALGLGVALSAANPKNLALTVAAAASIAQAGVSTGGTALTIAIFVVIGSLTVAGPVVFYLVATNRARGPLDAIKSFLAQHNAVIMMILFLVLGAKLLGDGIAGLAD